MKSILISINPKWCEKICHIIGYEEDGTPIYEKGVEVRKTKPQCNTPIKVLIYCTMNGGSLQMVNGVVQKVNEPVIDLTKDSVIYDLNGKVIGEFVCDEIITAKLGNYCNIPLKDACLDAYELMDYADDKPVYGWHISEIVIYDKPRELSEFFVADNIAVQSCEHRQIVGQPEYKTNHNGWIKGGYVCNKSGEPDWCSKCKTKALSRPPQSWCYVEEVHNGTVC